MTTANKFAVMTGLPEYGERANIANVNLDDVITYRVKGYWVFSVVIGTTTTMIQVVDLFVPTTLSINNPCPPLATVAKMASIAVSGQP